LRSVASEKNKAKTRIKILEASVDVIIEKGYKSASMREIARRAGVGDATIYNYFPSFCYRIWFIFELSFFRI